MLINELKPNSGKKTSPPQDRWDKLAGAIIAATSAVSGKASARVGATVPPATSKATGSVGVAVSGTNSSSVRAAGSNGSRFSAALNDTQREEAELVARLSADFPFAKWDSMPTKAQLITMQNSGLNTQEQWRLHNASTPLEVLALANTAQSRVKSGTLTDREANDLIDRSLRYAAARYQLTSGNASSLPPLQKGLLRGKLEEVIADLHKQVDGTSSDGPAATPTPSSTPLPQPGPTPELSTSGLIQKLSKIDRTLLSAESIRELDTTIEKLQGKRITGSEYSVFVTTYERLLKENAKNKYLDRVKSDSAANATWDESMIYNQNVYSSKAGTFGPLGSLAANGCGFVAIHDANQLLGFHTNASDLFYSLNQHSGLTTNLFGELGMNPLVIGDYYRQNGAQVTLYLNTTDIPKDHDAYIALFFHSDGAHYVAAEYNASTKTFDVYNLLAEDEPDQMKSLSASYYPDDESRDTTHNWIVWGIDSTVNTNDGFSCDPFESDSQYHRGDL